MKNCEEIREKLSAFIDDELSPAEQALIEHHLEQCSSCRDEEKSLRQINTLLDSIPDANPVPVFASQAVHRAASWRRCDFAKERIWKPLIAFGVDALSLIFRPQQFYASTNRYLRNFDDFPPESLSSFYVRFVQGES